MMIIKRLARNTKYTRIGSNVFSYLKATKDFELNAIPKVTITSRKMPTMNTLDTSLTCVRVYSRYLSLFFGFTGISVILL